MLFDELGLVLSFQKFSLVQV